MHQTVLFASQLDSYTNDLFMAKTLPIPIHDARLLPLAVVLAVTGFQIFHAIIRRIRLRANKSGRTSVVGHNMEALPASMSKNVIGRPSHIIFCLRIVRLVSAIILLILSTTTLWKCGEQCDNAEKLLRKCPEFGLTLALLVATVMAIMHVVSRTPNSLAGASNIIILLSVLGVYAYRDVYPSATYILQPADINEGNILWVKIFVLTMAAIIIPLSTPRVYVPIDSKNPMSVPSPEQTASWISRFTFSHVNFLVVLASKLPHLSYKELPPLMDYESSKYQSGKAFLHIETTRMANRHIFFGLFRHFRQEYAIFGFSMLLATILSFVAPFAIKKTLQYLETGGEGSYYRPWVWISLLLLGPILGSIAEHWCFFTHTKIRVRLQAIVTQLVFEHSLRIRLKAETATKESGQAIASSAATLTDARDLTSLAVSALEIENHLTATDAEGSEHAGSLTPTTEANEHSTQSKVLATPPASDSNQESKGDNLIGKINNLVTTDLSNMTDAVDFVELVFRVPFQIILCLIFLYNVLGWSSFVGLTSIIALTPVGGYIGHKMQKIQTTKMKMTDSRVQKISEAVNVLRMVKMFGWETKMTHQLTQSREVELGWLWKMKILTLITSTISYLVPMLSMLLTYSTYTVIMKEQLNASKIFSSMAVFNILIEQLHRIAWQTSLVIEGIVSIDRMNDFMRNTEVLDRFKDEHQQSSNYILDQNQPEELGFRHATFSWSVEENDGFSTPTTRRFRLHIEDELLFKRNRINLIIGPTGSGKTSMLMALLGEMHFLPSSADSWYHLPREGGVAYAAQESWVQNATIRENILFQSPYDEERYKKVLYQCALETDLKLLGAGDQTEVGERGLTLSGGQKARITLARAIYSSAQIVLLDDVLAALDVHTASWIVNKCFRGDLVKGRTILLVTHNVALVTSLAQFVVSVGINGQVLSHGTGLDTAISIDPILASEVEHDKNVTDQEASLSPENIDLKSTGKLMVPEEISQGHITWKSMKLLLLGFGGNHPISFFLIIVAALFAAELASTLQTWFLGFWGAQYETHHPSEVSLVFYLTMFAAILLGHIVIYTVTNIYYQYHAINASRIIHAKLIDSVFGSTLRWLDQTPTSRIIARCTQDIRTIDHSIAQSLMWVLAQVVAAIIKLFAITYLTPVFLLPGVAIGSLAIFVGNLYLKAQLSVKRETSNARSPMLAHFSAAIHGLVSLRAYDAQQSFKDESYKRIDHYSRTSRTSWDLNRWVGLRVDALGAIFSASLAAYLVYIQPASASDTGFSMNLAVSFSMSIFWLIRVYNDLEVESNSLERVQDYIDIEHEPLPTETGKPPASWPTSGSLRVEKLSAQYSPSGPKVLQNISFNVKSGERIGVVGRTGSGKSSFTLALLRCILTEGTIFYDEIPTKALNLDALRSNITIIPQTPELLSGTIRENMDPFGENDDLTLNGALESSGLLSLQQDDSGITLDTQISGSGSNLSVGQRQIIALARAIVRKSKLLILDEATSAVDYKTDAVIQRTLRTEIGSDVTVITIAHRLQTIMDSDKIMVLDSGSLVEFDTPKNLLNKQEGVLRSLVEDSGDKHSLFTLVDAASK